jgi:hypothetical protein
MVAENGTSLKELLGQFEAEHDLLRQLVVPEEDRVQFTSAKWSGEYRKRGLH